MGSGPTTQPHCRLGASPVQHGWTEAGHPWIRKGRCMSNSGLVRFVVAATLVLLCVARIVQPHSQIDDGGEDLGELLPTSALVDLRAEIVLETTVEDARRVRLSPDVNHISQRKVGQQGRVRITVDLPESVIPKATSQSCIWSRSSLRAPTGMLLYQSVEQREELSYLLFSEARATGRVICESPRWVIIDTSTGLNSDDVISRLKEWRVAGLISEDISHRSWRVDNEGRVDLSIGVIDSGATAEIRNVDPRFTTGACKALLSAIGILVDCRSIVMSEVFDSEGTASRTLTVNVSKNDIDRLVGISRSFKRHDEQMRVLFKKGKHFPEHNSETAPHGGSTPARTPKPILPSKRSHVPSSTPQRLIKTKLEDELMTVMDESAHPANVAVEPGDKNLVGCLETPALQTPCKHTVAPGDIVRTPQLVRGVATGSEESVRVVKAVESGWIVARIGLPGAKLRRATRDGAEGWIVEQPLRNPLQWSKWFGIRRHGAEAETETVRCKDKWDMEDSEALLVRGDYSTDDSGELLYSLDKARKCGELEAAGLLWGLCRGSCRCRAAASSSDFQRICAAA